MPSWKSRVPKTNTLPERQMREILQEMKDDNLIKTFIGSKWIQTPFRRKGIKQEADFLVDKILVIEVQGAKWHEKKRQKKKDIAKRESFEAMGYTVLWIWDDELRYANPK